MSTQTSKLLQYKTTKQWFAATEAKPAPRPLAGDFWHEGELAIMFADTGLGKSVLAVQIGESIATNDGSEPDVLACRSAGKTVLYLDLELTDKQFELRYSGENDDGEVEHCEMSDRFLRATIDPYAEIPEGMDFTQYLMQEIERCLAETGAGVLIVDNISFLRGSQASVREATALMRDLRRMMERLEISILVLAHTPKRSAHRPLTLNDLQGSKAMSNFADSIFAIGESCLGPDIRYIKQLKCRSREIAHDAGYVPGFMILKTGPLLEFDHVAFGTELSHLKDFDASHRLRHERWGEIERLRGKGFSQREIAAKLDISAASVNRYINSYVSYPHASGGKNVSDLYKCYGFRFRRQIVEEAEKESAATPADQMLQEPDRPAAASVRQVDPGAAGPRPIARVESMNDAMLRWTEELNRRGDDHQAYLSDAGLLE